MKQFKIGKPKGLKLGKGTKVAGVGKANQALKGAGKRASAWAKKIKV